MGESRESCCRDALLCPDLPLPSVWPDTSEPLFACRTMELLLSQARSSLGERIIFTREWLKIY